MWYEGSTVTLEKEDFYLLLKGKYRLIPCGDCYEGMEYWDSESGELISSKEYFERVESFGVEEGTCQECNGLGKLIVFDEG